MSRFGKVSAKITLGVCFFCLVTGPFLRAATDFAFINVVIVACLFISGCIGLLWFALESRFSKAVRWAPLTAAGLAIGLFFALFRISDVSGELVPVFSWRWSRRVSLPPPVTTTDIPTADLTTTTPDDFPRFLGPQANNRVDGLVLERDWQTTPPRKLWRQPIGAGWGTFAVVNGWAVTLEQHGDDEAIVCYEVRTGRQQWRHAYPARHVTLLGGLGPRSTPTIHEGRVYAFGATGRLTCLEGADGREVWHEDVLARCGTKAEDQGSLVSWGRAASPLIVGDRVFVPGGGPEDGPWHSLLAYDRHDGRLLWKGGERQIAYGTPALVTLAGVQHVSLVLQDYAAGFALADGRLLWETPWNGKSYGDANNSQTVPIGPSRLLLSKGYGQGSELLEFTASGDRLEPRVVWKNIGVLKTKFTNVVLHDGLAFALSDGVLECVDVATGKRRWKKGRFGQGQILGVGDLLLVLAEDGELLLVSASPDDLREWGRIEALQGKTWNHLCLTGRLLLVRNGEEAACYELPVSAGAR